MIPALALALSFQGPIKIAPPAERYRLEMPLPGLSGIMADTYNDGQGLAQQWARAHGVQARIMWIDGTANLDKVNTPEKIEALTKQLANVGFNTIVFDIKPISGQVLYKSAYAPKLEAWRGQTLPKDFDPLPVMVREAHKNGLTLLVSMNCFSEGHNLMHTGPGFNWQDRQSVEYVPMPVLDLPLGRSFPVNPKANPTDWQGFRTFDVQLFSSRKGLKGVGPGVALVDLSPDGVVRTATDDGSLPEYHDGDTVLLAPTSKIVASESRALISGDALVNLQPGTKLTMDSTADFERSADHPDQYALMMNPNDPEVQVRMLLIVKEVLTKYGVDGFLFDDRLRYAGMDADFSPVTRELFEKYVGAKLSWPDDVFKYTFNTSLHQGIKPGKYFDAWMTWRALQMRNWVARVRREVNEVRPNALFGIYAGSWYGEYPEFGSNYGGSSLEAGFQFLTPDYEKTGFARLLDFVITGCYYTEPTIYGAMAEGKSIGSTVEAAGQLSNRVADDQCWTVAGLLLESFGGDEDAIQKALEAACESTQGVMVFDLSHHADELWPALQQAFRSPVKSPFKQMGLLTKVRKLRELYKAYGAHERPVVISSGTSGTGF